jgi:hypothetical protein
LSSVRLVLLHLWAVLFPPGGMSVPFPFPNGRQRECPAWCTSPSHVSSPLGQSPMCPVSVDVLAIGPSSPVLARLPMDDVVSQVSMRAQVLWFTFPHVSPDGDNDAANRTRVDPLLRPLVVVRCLLQCIRHQSTLDLGVVQVLSHVAVALCSGIPQGPSRTRPCVSCVRLPGECLRAQRCACVAWYPTAKRCSRSCLRRCSELHRHDSQCHFNPLSCRQLPPCVAGRDFGSGTAVSAACVLSVSRSAQARRPRCSGTRQGLPLLSRCLPPLLLRPRGPLPIRWTRRADPRSPSSSLYPCVLPCSTSLPMPVSWRSSCSFFRRALEKGAGVSDVESLWRTPQVSDFLLNAAGHIRDSDHFAPWQFIVRSCALPRALSRLWFPDRASLDASLHHHRSHRLRVRQLSDSVQCSGRGDHPGSQDWEELPLSELDYVHVLRGELTLGVNMLNCVYPGGTITDF